MKTWLNYLSQTTSTTSINQVMFPKPLKYFQSWLVLMVLLVGKNFVSDEIICLTYITLENASRPGCISNMTLKELESREIQSDGSYIISVLNHKIVATAGPAMLLINPDIMHHLRIYLKICNSLPGISLEDRDPVFASWSGRKMDSTMVTTQLNQFWKIAVNKDLSRAVNPSLIRKMTTTTVHEKKPSRKREVAKNHESRCTNCREKLFFTGKEEKCV